MFDEGVVLDAPSAWLDEHFDALEIDPAIESLDADSALEEVAACERIVAMAQARQLRALARFADLRSAPRTGLMDEFAADELAPLLRISRSAAHARLELAVELTGRLPGTVHALDQGEVDMYKARIIAGHTNPLTDEQAAAVERRIFPRAAEQTPGQLRASLRRAVLRIDPDGAERRRQVRVRRRAVVLEPREDGTANLAAINLDAADAVAAYQQLDAYALAQGSEDGRSMDQRRADALIDLILGRNPGAQPAAGTQVHVTVAASTLLGLDELPGHLAGYGAISAQAARELAAEGTWRRIMTDPATGTVLDVGRTTYRPPKGLAEHVRTRDRTCRFPGCRQPAHRCDLDHGEPYPQGRTSADNLSCLCRHHHRLKHKRDWTVEHGQHGAVTWRSPTGRTYQTAPEPIVEPPEP